MVRQASHPGWVATTGDDEPVDADPEVAGHHIELC
jgi:hypothetical protein